MGLLDDKTTDEVTDPIYKLALGLSVTLINAAKKARKVSRSSSPANQAINFIHLFKDHPKDEVARVLDWYIKNFDKEFIPQAYSPKSFRLKYKSLIKAMNDNPQTPQQVSEVARSISSTVLRTYTWPNGIDQLVPSAVQETLNNYEEFLALFKKTREHLKNNENHPTLQKNERLRRFMQYLMDMHYISSPKSFASHWFVMMAKLVASWPDLHQARSIITFHTQSTWFTRQGRGWAYNWCLYSVLWDDLMKEIKAHAH